MKRIIVFLLCIVLILLVGCSKDKITYPELDFSGTNTFEIKLVRVDLNNKAVKLDSAGYFFLDEKKVYVNSLAN